MKTPSRGYAWWLLLAAICLFWGSNSYHRPDIAEKLERLIYDRQLAHLDAPRVKPEIVLVMAGEDSLSHLGQWPWPRSVHANLLDRLTQAHTVILDILFPDKSSPEEDRALVDAVGRINSLVIAMHVTPSASGGPTRIVAPFPMLNSLPNAKGFTNMDTDIDGMVRFCRLYHEAEGRIIPSLPLAAALTILGRPASLNMTDEDLPVDAQGKLWINHGNSNATVYEYSQVLNGEVPRDVFRDKIVMVGVSAPGIEDYFKIPSEFGSREISGAQLNCNIIKSLLTEKVPSRVPPLSDAILTVIMVLAGAAVTLIRRPIWNFSALLLLGTSFFLLHQYQFSSFYVYTAFSLPFSGMLSAFSILLFLKLKYLHKETEIKTFSISSIIGLPHDLEKKIKTYDNYLCSIWKKIEKSTGIHLLAPRTTWKEVAITALSKAKSGHSMHHGKVILVEDGKGPYKHLAMIPVSPCHRSEEQTYTLLGWKKQLTEPHIQAVIAMVLSTSWYFERLKQADEQKQLLLDTIHAISAAIDAKDPVTGGHSNRVSILAKEIAEQLNLNQQDQDDIYLGALIHDIGKIGVPDSILSKTGKLTNAEMETIRRHPLMGKQIMASVKMPETVARAVYEHHERYNGTGYPLGLKGDQIDLAGRIIAVADVFDALISDRPYREAMPIETALAYMQASADIEFDGAVVQALCSVVALKGVPASGREPFAMAS